MTQLARDDRGNAIQAAHPARSQRITVTATTARNSTDFGSAVSIVELTPSVDMWVAFGDDTVTATAAAGANIPLKAGIVYAYDLRENLRIAAIRDSADGVLDIVEIE